MKIVTRDYNSEITGKIHTLLYLLGANAGSCGFFQASYAVYLVVEQPERLQYITKYLYPAVAREYDTNWRAVERNIRHVANRAWHANPDLLRKISFHRLFSRPTPTQFIALLAAYVGRPDGIEMNDYVG